MEGWWREGGWVERSRMEERRKDEWSVGGGRERRREDGEALVVG